MSYRRFAGYSSVVLLSLLMSACAGLGGGGSAPTPTPTPVPTAGSLNSLNHIILFMQENRSFDHYFGQLNAYRAKQNPPLPQDVDTWGPNKTPAGVSTPGFDPTTVFGQGPPIPAFHMQSACSENATASWDESHVSFNLKNGNNNLGPFLMNGFAFVQGHFARDEAAKGNTFLDLTGKRAMGYYDDSDLPFYYFI